MTALNLQVGAGLDDVTCWLFDSTHTFQTGSTIGRVGFYSWSFRRAGRADRFTGVSIPQGSDIDAAHLSVRAYSASPSGGTVTSDLYLDAADDSGRIGSDADLHGRTPTTKVVWGPPAFSANVWYDSASIITPVQEVIDRVGWNQGAVTVYWEDFDGVSPQGAWRRSWCYEGDSASAVKLDIDYTAGGPAIIEGAAVLSGAGALAAAAYAIASGASVLSGAGTLSASALGIAFGASTLSGLGALEGVGVRVVPGVATLSGIGALTADAFLVVDAQATLPGTGALSADGLAITFAAADLSGTGALSGTGTRIVLGVVALSGIGALTATGQVIPGGIIVDGAATLSGVGALSADGLSIAIASAPLTGIGDLSGTALLIVPAAALLTGLGALEGTGQVVGYFVTAPGQMTIGNEVVTTLEVSDQLAVTSSLPAEGELAASRLNISDTQVTKLTISDEP